MGERERARRNQNPHAEARLAMALWSYEYAHKQKGGCMDFWDNLPTNRKRICADVVDGILQAEKENGRADRP